MNLSHMVGVLSTPWYLAGILSLGSVRARSPVRAETYLLAFVNLVNHIDFKVSVKTIFVSCLIHQGLGVFFIWLCKSLISEKEKTCICRK